MKKKITYIFATLLCLGLLLLSTLYLLDTPMAILNPKGIVGIKEKELLIITTLLMLIVVVPVFVLTFFISWKYRASNKKAKYTPDFCHSHLAEAIWWGLPCAIIIVISVFTWKACYDLDPFKPIASPNKPVKIQVVALQWKWLFIYPEENVATVNFVQFPVNTPVDFEITSDAPMNSFWIPQLGGQVFAMAGMRTKLHLMADEPSIFRGASANISGEGFSGMFFNAKSTSREEFEKWVDEIKNSSPPLNLDSYIKLSEPSSYLPPTTYTLAKDNLFEWILMKYMMPMNEVK